MYVKKRHTHWLASSKTTVTPSTVHSVFIGRMWIYFSSTLSLLFTKFPVIYNNKNKPAITSWTINLYFTEEELKRKNLITNARALGPDCNFNSVQVQDPQAQGVLSTDLEAGFLTHVLTLCIINHTSKLTLDQHI